jgi:hypothetical protein
MVDRKRQMPGLPVKEAVPKVTRRKCLSAGGGEEG